MADQPRLTRVERRIRASIASADAGADAAHLFHWMKQHHRSMRVRHRGGSGNRARRDRE